MRPLAKTRVGVMFAAAAALVFAGCTGGTYGAYTTGYGYDAYDYYDPYYGSVYYDGYDPYYRQGYYPRTYRYYTPRYSYAYPSTHRYFYPRTYGYYPLTYRYYSPRTYRYYYPRGEIRAKERFKDRDRRVIRDHRRDVRRHDIRSRDVRRPQFERSRREAARAAPPRAQVRADRRPQQVQPKTQVRIHGDSRGQRGNPRR